MTQQEVDKLLEDLAFYLKAYPTMRTHHANMKAIDKEIATAVRQLKTRGADAQDDET